MNDIKSNPLKYIKTFSLVYIICAVVSQVIYHAACAIVYQMPVTIPMLLWSVIDLVPYGLFMLYIFAFCEKDVKSPILPISFIAACVLNIVYIFSDISVIIRFVTVSSMSHLLITKIISIMFTFLGTVIFALLAIDCFIGFKFRGFAQVLVILQIVLMLAQFLPTMIIYLIFNVSLEGISYYNWFISLLPILASVTYFIFWRFAIPALREDKTKEQL